VFLEIGGIISTMSINIIPYTKKLSRINVGRFPHRAARTRLSKCSFALWVTFSI